jgi:hypothetical protein
MEQMEDEQKENEKVQAKVRANALKLYRNYRKVFNTPDGQWVLRDLMKRGHMLEPCYKGDRNDLIHADGERNLVLQILTILKTDIVELENQITLSQQETDNDI